MQGPPISNIYYYEQQAVYLSRPSAGLHRQWSFLPRTLPLALCHLCRIELAVSYLYTGKGHRDGLLQICRREINPCFHSAVHYPLRRSMGKLSALDEPEKQTERSYSGRK